MLITLDLNRKAHRDMIAVDTRPCACGSGLRALRCCAWDVATAAVPGASNMLSTAISAAFDAKAHGDDAKAGRLCLEVLELSPGDISCLKLLAEMRMTSHPAAAEALVRRVVALDPDDWSATCDLALLLIRRSNLSDAEVHARNAIRLAPENAQSHNLMGLVMTETGRPQAGEYHYRRALELCGQEPPGLLADFAENLKNQGKVKLARELYQKATDAEPQNLRILLGFARLEEADRNIAAASSLLDRCDTLAPADGHVMLQRAILLGRTQSYGKALETLDAVARTNAETGLGPQEWLEKGRLLDQMGRHDEAFAAFHEGKRLAVERSGQSYDAQQAEHLVRHLKGFFTTSRLGILPRATRAPGAQPIFVVGFPRSGTTLLEQMLTAHSQISAGDELPFINQLSAIMPRLLASPLVYPEALAELWMGDHREGLDDLRNHYLQQARRYGFIERNARWFTDKMPLNETHLGLISLVFPESPIVHVLRHPLDVVLSVFSNQLTHGFFCSYALETAARHYALIFDLVAHYRSQLTMNYLAVRYEDMVDQQQASLQKVFDFIGVPFEAQCLRFEENKRYARTASYAQVTEKLYDRSRYRYRAYRKELEPVIPILRDAIEKLGYGLD